MKEYPDLGFKVGDEVEDYKYQANGVIYSITTAHTYPVNVRWDDGTFHCYTLKGQHLDEHIPTLGYTGTIDKFNSAFPDGLAIVTKRPKPKVQVKVGQVWALSGDIYVVESIDELQNVARFKNHHCTEYCSLKVMEDQILQSYLLADSATELIAKCTEHPHLTNNELKELNH